MERKMSLPIRILLIVAALSFAGLLFYNVGQCRTYQNQDQKLSKIGFIGVYQPEGSSLTYEWSEDQEINENRYTSVTFAGNFDRDIPKNENMLFFLSDLGMELYVNGEQVASLGKPGSFPDSSKTAGKGWYSLSSPGISREDMITIVLDSRYRYNEYSAYNSFATKMYTGNAKDLFVKLLLTDGLPLLAGGIIAIAGFILLLSLSLLNLLGKTDGRAPANLALFLLSGGIWMALYPGVLTLLVPMGIFFSLFYTAAAGLAVSFLMIYLMDFVNGRIRWCLPLITVCCLCGAIAAIFLQGLGIWDGSQVLYLFVVPGMAGLLTAAVSCIRKKRKQCQEPGLLHTISILLLILLGGFDLLNSVVHLISGSYGLLIGFCVFSVLQFVIAVGYIRKHMEKNQTVTVPESGNALEVELLRSRIDIMLSQLQLDFLYSTLISIRYLCDSDSKKAEYAIKEFAEYLKGNVGSLTNENLIPFQMELEHVRHYLELEKMRYPEQLNVLFEIRAIDFQIPSLALQAVVENAVRHGVSKKRSGGTVIITSWETEDEYQIAVTDDGVGFNPGESLDVSGHAGLANAKKRIFSMCQGTLRIYSELGSGTTVTLVIPK